MTEINFSHKAKKSKKDLPTKNKQVDAKNSTIEIIDIQECRKILEDYTSTDAEIIQLRDNLEILINNILNEALNGKSKNSDILPSIQ